MSELEVVDYGFDTIQMEADKSKRLGLCYGCLNKERDHESKGEPPQGMHYAAVIAPSVHNVPMALPGIGTRTMPVSLAIPSCLYCLTSVKPSVIQPVNGALP